MPCAPSREFARRRASVSRRSRLLIVLCAAVIVTGCAHPERIKTISKEHEALLRSFHVALDDVRLRVRTAMDESIQAYRDAWIRRWVVTETNALSSRLVGCVPNPGACESSSIRVLLDEASVYLAEGQATLFGTFCAPDGTWATAKRPWMKAANERCFESPRQTAERMAAVRDKLDAQLRRLSADLVEVQRGHAIIDKFLQIRIEVRQEDVDAAQKTIARARTAVEDAQVAFQALQKEAAR